MTPLIIISYFSHDYTRSRNVLVPTEEHHRSNSETEFLPFSGAGHSRRVCRAWTLLRMAGWLGELCTVGLHSANHHILIVWATH